MNHQRDRKRILAKGGNGSFAYATLATDGDGTLLLNKHMARATVAALARLRSSGRKAILVTGETQQELSNFPHLALFDMVVAENGAVLYTPETRRATRLSPSPPAAFVRELRKRGVKTRSVGKVIVSVEYSDVPAMGDVIRKLGMDWRLVPNRKSVMALPPGVDKSSGLAAALNEMNLSPEKVVGVGDAENDLVMLLFCGCGVAVARSVPLLLGQADVVTEGATGRGVVELIDRMLAGTLPRPVVRPKSTGSVTSCG